MLILTRRPDEALHIGDNVTVTVLGSQGDQVRLGIAAPDDVVIHRSGVYQQIDNVRPVLPAELVEAWSREHPAPTLIEYRPYQGTEPQRTYTVGRASVSLGGAAVIWIEDQSAPVALRACTAVSWLRRLAHCRTFSSRRAPADPTARTTEDLTARPNPNSRSSTCG